MTAVMTAVMTRQNDTATPKYGRRRTRCDGANRNVHDGATVSSAAGERHHDDAGRRNEAHRDIVSRPPRGTDRGRNVARQRGTQQAAAEEAD